MNPQPTIAHHTLGCKLNHAETVTIGKQFLERGYRLVEFGLPADVTVINTCSVTDRADRECRQLIRRARRVAPGSTIVVTGCYAQLQPEAVASIEGVHAVLGTKEKFRAHAYLEMLEGESVPKIFVSDIENVDSFSPAFSTDAGSRTRAYLKVQDGCDYNCSFCTIPLARGRSRSQPVEACLRQARELIASGYREIVLTGLNVGDYDRRDGSTLAGLLRELVKVRGLDRLRISSIEPNLLSAGILDLVANEPLLCHHFHIPLQSGHDQILRGMRRRYTTALYRDVTHRVMERIPDCGIGADVIAGFPGETEEHFEATCRFIETLPLSYLHVFTYSERPDTPAGTFPGAVPPSVRFRRSRTLRLLGEKKRRAFLERMVGQTVSVLLEGRVEEGIRYGLTDNYVRVGLPADGTHENELVHVKIREVRGQACLGEVEGSRI